MPVNPSALRENYTLAGLSEEDAGPDPFGLFDRWFGEALQGGVPEPNAMTLATVDEDGQPTARIVLLKGMDAEGFTFFTNYDSRKGRALAAHPRAALVFWWVALERQVCIEGSVERVPEVASEAYFTSRPRGSQLGAWASAQSTTVAGREELEARLAAVTERFEGQEVPRPPHWGGYRVRPTRFEFWQGRPSRLHDRIEYLLTSGGWQRQRLAP